MAIGSFDPLSTSSVAVSRAGSFRPLVRRIEKTAAASVEPTMLPSSMPWSSGTPSTHAAAKPVSMEVSSTPSVESDNAGFQVERTDANDVRRPPSNRIKARATLPMLFARR